MEVEWKDASLVRQVLEAIRGPNLSQVVIRASDISGWRLQELMELGTCMVELHILPAAFSRMTIEGGECTMGVDLSTMLQRLRMGDADDILSMRVPSGNLDFPPALQIEFTPKKAKVVETVLGAQAKSDKKRSGKRKPESRAGTVRKFECNLVKLDWSPVDVPDTIYSAIVSMSSAEFQRTIKDCKSIGDSVEIHITREVVRFRVVDTSCGIDGGVMYRTGTGSEQDDVSASSALASTHDHKNSRDKSGKKGSFLEAARPRTTTTTMEGKLSEQDIESVDIKRSSQELAVHISFTPSQKDDGLEQKFRLAHLEMCSRAAIVSERVTLYLATEMPMRLEFTLEKASDTRFGTLRFYVAPIVVETEEANHAPKTE